MMLEQTLRSLESCRVPEGVVWEIVVVDNNSTDATSEVCDRYQNRLPLRRVMEPKAGKSHALNASVEHSSGEFILWTDDDVLVDTQWISATLRAFDSFKADVVYGRSEPWWETERPAWFSKKLMGRFALLDHGDQAQVVTDENQVGYGLNTAFRRSALDKIGGYCLDMGPRHGKGAGGEDTDIFLRAHRAGLTVAYTPESNVRHFIPDERCKKAYTRRRVWFGSEDYLEFLRRESGSVATLFGIPRYLYPQAATNVWNYLRGLVTRNHGEAFHFELKLLQFAGLLYWNCKSGGKTKASA